MRFAHGFGSLDLRDLDLAAEAEGSKGEQSRCYEVECARGRDRQILRGRRILAGGNANTRSAILGQIGVKAWLAVTVTNTRFGVFPAPTQVVPQVIDVPSAHSQLAGNGEEPLGNVNAGLKFPEFCMAFLMPVMQLVA